MGNKMSLININKEKVELFEKPRKLVEELISLPPDEPEMSEYESAFVCGVIKKIRPKKIVEIGIAAGGTTAVILKCLDLLKMHDCEFWSIDINDNYYVDPTQKTGFLGTEIKKTLQTEIKHLMLTGGTIANYIDKIGPDIDLVILDTAHILPGEVLDFPVLLPFMKRDGLIILHDIALHLYKSKQSDATQVLFSASVGEKTLPLGEDCSKQSKLPNIGMVKINEDSYRYIESVFCSMCLPWGYLPSEDVLEGYRKFYLKYYPIELVEIFEEAVKLNKYNLCKTPEKMRLKKRITRCLSIAIRGY